MGSVSESREISVFVDPGQLRRWADEMEEAWKTQRLGQRVWSARVGDTGNASVRIVTDQDYFHRRDRGLPDWDDVSPSPEALSLLEKVRGDSDFPQSYSGSAWCAAWHIWKVVKDNPDLLDGNDGFKDIPGVDLPDLGLSGFQYGWALNAVRQMLGKKPGPNPAIVTIGAREELPYPSTGPAESAMKRAMG